MINISLIQKNNSEEMEDVEITLPLFMEEEFMAPLKKEYTLEILKGQRLVVDEENVKYLFKLQPEDAADLKEAILLAYTKHSGHNTNN